MKKGYSIAQLAPITIIFIVAFFLFSIGSIIMQDLGESFCDYTWITNTTIASGAIVGNNPVTSAWYGCCQTVGSGNNCSAWYTSKTSLNVSAQGLDSITELSSWGPTLALVIIAAIIISVLITYLAKGR